MLEPEALQSMTSAPVIRSATSNELRVRVEFSKKRFATVRPRSESSGRFGALVRRGFNASARFTKSSKSCGVQSFRSSRFLRFQDIKLLLPALRFFRSTLRRVFTDTDYTPRNDFMQPIASINPESFFPTAHIAFIFSRAL